MLKNRTTRISREYDELRRQLQQQFKRLYGFSPAYTTIDNLICQAWRQAKINIRVLTPQKKKTKTEDDMRIDI